jgi:hypothetical protein
MQLNRIKRYILVIGASFLMAGCATPTIMLNHSPQKLMILPVDSIIPPPSIDLQHRNIILTFSNDGVTQPIGAYLDDYNGEFTKVVQTYTISNPGHVLFESISRYLSKANATVFNQYCNYIVNPNTPKDAQKVDISVTQLEMHYWRSKQGDFYLAHGQVTCSIDAGPVISIQAEARALSSLDIFDALSAKIGAELGKNILGQRSSM